MPKPAHYDISIDPGEYYDDEFVLPNDLSGWRIELYLNGILNQTTADGSMTMTVDKPSAGETTVSPIFTMDQTLAMASSNTYRLIGINTKNVKIPLFTGKITMTEDP